MEQVILVDEQDNEIGVAPKETIHSDHTPLHRAFSLFLFNSKKQLLVTKRASIKKTFPGVWTNSVCGHIQPGEETIDAVKRRVQEELGITVSQLYKIAPYRYRFADIHGIIENEICPIYVGQTDEVPTPNKDEIESWKWIDWNEFLTIIRKTPGTYSPWSEEEAEIVDLSYNFN